MAEAVVQFRAGEDVPQWLLGVVPNQPGAQFVSFQFGTRVEVVETPDYYIVVPLDHGPQPDIMQLAGAGLTVFAPGKPVKLALVVSGFMPDTGAAQEYGPLVFGVPPQAPAAPTPAPSLNVVGDSRWYMTPPARPGFWRRLWNAMGA